MGRFFKIHELGEVKCMAKSLIYKIYSSKFSILKGVGIYENNDKSSYTLVKRFGWQIALSIF